MNWASRSTNIEVEMKDIESANVCKGVPKLIRAYVNMVIMDKITTLTGGACQMTSCREDNSLLY